ncbi:MAG: hypothetical protein NVSMB57_07010 [Actinomycetota bacterium]
MTRATFEHDAANWESGLLSTEAVAARHPDTDVRSMLAPHERLMSVTLPDFPATDGGWEALAARLPDRKPIPVSRPLFRIRRAMVAAFAISVFTASISYATGVGPVRQGVTTLVRSISHLFDAPAFVPPPVRSRGHQDSGGAAPAARHGVVPLIGPPAAPGAQRGHGHPASPPSRRPRPHPSSGAPTLAENENGENPKNERDDSNASPSDESKAAEEGGSPRADASGRSRDDNPSEAHTPQGPRKGDGSSEATADSQPSSDGDSAPAGDGGSRSQPSSPGGD